MKKLIVLALFLSVVVLPAFAREATIAELVEMAVSKLDRPVPEGFQRIDRTTFINDNIIVVAPNGITTISTFGRSFETTREAYILLGSFFDYFENTHNNWALHIDVAGGAVYINGGIFAFIQRPAPRDDGRIVTQVAFTRIDIFNL
ncbi:MAG: hypothetical protein LBG93_05020 [Treponema sp.]|jgi:hypothetical protein|nr:hypothetical protein [Treponema sp.]